MTPLHITTLALLAVGGLNWGLVGLFDFDLVAAILGEGSILARLVYIVVALCALYQVATIGRKAEASVNA